MVMAKTSIWAAAAALSLYAGAGCAFAAEPATAAAHEAAKDAAPRIERREMRIYRHGEGGPAVHVLRGDRHRDVIMMKGGDRTEQLRTLLQLRPEQDGALKAYVAAVTPKRDTEGFKRAHRGAEAQATPERLAAMEARMAEQQTAMRQRIAATRAFYDQLDARQKKVFDAMPMLMFAGPGYGPMPMPIVHRMGPPLEPPPAPPVPKS